MEKLTVKSKIELTSDFFTQKSIILGVSGYGKSYTARRIIELGIELKVPMGIVDPQGAYENLGEYFYYIDAQDVKDPRALGLLLAKTNKSYVLRMKELMPDAQNEFLEKFLSAYKKHQNVGIKTLIIDELHKYAPQYEQTVSKPVILGLIQENRGDGLGFIGISQMPAVISKTPIKQASNKFIGYMEEYNDIKAVRGFLSDGYSEEDIKRLKVGEFFIKLTAKPAVVDKIEKVTTKHSGQTPKNLLNEDNLTFGKYISKVYKKKSEVMKMENPVKTVTDVLPSKNQFMDLAGLGAKVALGGAVAGVVGNVVSPFIQRFNPLRQFVSGRTIGALGTTVVLYAVYSKLGDNSRFKDVLKYATAGSAVYTLGSAVFDVIAVTRLPVPPIVANVIAMASGASPMVVENSGVDLNTAQAE